MCARQHICEFKRSVSCVEDVKSSSENTLLIYPVYRRCRHCRGTRCPSITETVCIFGLCESLKSTALHAAPVSLWTRALWAKDTVAFFSYHEAVPDAETEDGGSLEGAVLGRGCSSAEGALAALTALLRVTGTVSVTAAVASPQRLRWGF